MIIKSLVSETELRSSLNVDLSLMNIAQNKFTLIDHLIISSVFCPELLIIKDTVFLSEFYGKTDFEHLEKDCNGDKTLMEKMINTKLLSDFFLVSQNFDNSINERESLLLQFGIILKFFWQNWFVKNFPDRYFIIETGKGLFPEQDIAITVYQDRLIQIG